MERPGVGDEEGRDREVAAAVESNETALPTTTARNTTAPRRAATRTSPKKQTGRKTAAKKTTKKGVAPSEGRKAGGPAGQTATASKRTQSSAVQAKFPRHDVVRALRIPRAILDQNAGHACTPTEAAKFLGGSNSGPFQLEISSAKKYGFLESDSGNLLPTERAKRAIRPQTDTDELDAFREAILDAPDLSAVYKHYRGEYLPDEKFFANALIETFSIPRDKVLEFQEIFSACLESARLVQQVGSRRKIIDIGRDETSESERKGTRAPARKSTTIADRAGSCFVVQPFGPPFGGYFETVFKPAIEAAGLRPVRADAEIFGAGKVMDQVWRGIRTAEVLVAELTTKNPNVYYELGLAHALGKPVVLVSSDEGDVPFDLRHIRVIYYEKSDPFWGNKLIDKIAENVRSAIENPEEAIFTVDET